MCAIAGIQGENISREIQQMLVTLKHRGRDGSGVFVDGMISYGNLDELKIPEGNRAMGHNLLSIVGFEGLQPLKEDEMVLVCNGEIYNYRELREDLDHDFKSDSDVEVIMALLKKYYHDSLFQAVVKTIKCLDGDYAFAIYDGKDWAVLRDPVGVKPVYFGVDKNKNLSAFASERKALWKIGIEEVETIPPGYILYNWELKKMDYGLETILNKELNLKAKYSSKNVNQGLIEVLKGKLEASLINSVEKRLRGLSEVGVMFSGGIDSTLLARLSDDLGVETILYSVGHEDSADLKFAQKTADNMRLPIHLRKVTREDVRDYLPLVLNSIEEFNLMKLGVGMPAYMAAEMAHDDNIKVMLSGQGADELFAGYHRYLKLYQEQGENTLNDLLEDIYNLYHVNLERDDKVTMASNVELRVPYLDLDVINIAMNIPMEYKITSEKDPQRKCILREIARDLGVPEENVIRPKKAAQYGSGIDKMLRKVLKDENYLETLDPRYNSG
jgi:asparagine synthase (glutamine-hydrolysing)